MVVCVLACDDEWVRQLVVKAQRIGYVDWITDGILGGIH